MSIGAEDGLTNVSGTISTEIFSTLLPQTQSLKLKVHKTNMYHIRIVKNVIFAKASCAFEIAKFMFDYHNYLFPTLLLNLFVTNGQINRYCTRTASNYQMHLCRTNLKQFTILYRGPKIWNSLPVSVTLQVFLVLWRRCNSFYSKNHWISLAAHSQLLFFSIYYCKWWPFPQAQRLHEVSSPSNCNADH